MRPEDRLRSRCRMYLNQALPPPLFYSAIEHGRKHGGDDFQRAKEWSRLKAQGVKTGLADIFIWAPRRFIAIELKAGKNDTSDKQDQFAAAMVANAHHYHVVRSVAELDVILRIYAPILPSMRIAALGYDAELSAPEKVVLKKGGGGYRPPKPRANPTALRKLAAARKKGWVG